MKAQISQTIVRVDDAQIIALIDTAQEWLVYMAPGLSTEVALSLSNRWHALGSDRVKVILDVDPEIARLGYGTLEGLECIQNAAVEMNSHVFHQAGVRIGLVMVDHTFVIFSPTPLLIESNSNPGFQPNAICLDQIPQSIMNEIGWGREGDHERVIGFERVSSTKIDLMKADLRENPPQKFDITRTVQVFNSRFEFVEIEVIGCSISRKTASIPSDLLAFIRDKNTRDNLQSSSHIVRANSELTGKKIQQLRKQLVDKWLVPIPSFGTVVLRKNKDNLLEGIEELRAAVRKFQQDIQVELEKEIKHNCEALHQSFLPFVLQNPPARWINQIGASPTKDHIAAMLESDLRKSFGSAENLIRKMEVKVLFKAITYEMLDDPKFQKAIHKAMPALKITHDEFDAARVVQATLF